MWTHIAEPLGHYDGFKVTFQSHGTRLTRGECLELLCLDQEFRNSLTQVLKDIPFASFRWESPPVHSDALHKDFEFVVVDAPELEVAADKQTFAEYFRSMGAGQVGEFTNLSGDAQLIVPSPIDPDSNYNHFGAFLHSAPYPQIHALWKRVGDAATRLTGSRPLWLNTAGAGVSWLHIRVDRRPKYYVYQPYRDADA